MGNLQKQNWFSPPNTHTHTPVVCREPGVAEGAFAFSMNTATANALPEAGEEGRMRGRTHTFQVACAIYFAALQAAVLSESAKK